MSAPTWGTATTTSSATWHMYEVRFVWALSEPEAWRFVAAFPVRLSGCIAGLLATGTIAPEIAARMATRLLAHVRACPDVGAFWPADGGNERVLAALFLALEAEDEP